jgi:hypothetical protein
MKYALAALIFAGGSAMALAQAPAADTDNQDRATRAKQAQQREKCLGVAATRIKRADDPCSDRGRSYDRDDLSRTGETDAASALEKLDPSITRRR